MARVKHFTTAQKTNSKGVPDWELLHDWHPYVTGDLLSAIIEVVKERSRIHGVH